MASYVVIALYKFVVLENFSELKSQLLNVCNENNVKGTLILSREGINGTVAGNREAIDNVLSYLRMDDRLKDVEFKESFAETCPFYRMKIKIKKEIVTMGVENIDPNLLVGTYVAPEHWNALISDPEVVVVDTRNNYEYGVGTFVGAVNPETDSFRELPEFVSRELDTKKHKKIAMFCTGGIRCEKSTAYLKQQGFEEVFHLKGGILKYLEVVPEDESLWQGECFVFDNRVAVTHGLKQGTYDLCHGCRNPISEQDKLSANYKQGVHCPNCYPLLTEQQRTRFEERQKQIQLAKQKGKLHLGAPQPQRQKK